MKKFFGSILIIVLIIMLFTSGAVQKSIGNMITMNSVGISNSDTTNLTRLVVLDSFRLRILPPSSGVQFYKDQIVFLSASKNERKMSPNQISFGTVEAYFAPVMDTVTGRHAIFSQNSPFSFPTEAMTFSRDNSTIYYSKVPKKGMKEKIFMAKIKNDINGKISLSDEQAPLDFCGDDYNYSHPALSSDDSMMIFASDRIGSEGGMDLYVTKRSGGKWSAPENLGKDINSSGNEFFPFLDSDNNLYFSSDRQGGYGGYDIYTCKFNGKVWIKPLDLSDRINSRMDDIAFTINKTNGQTAFFTRRQGTDNGAMQLFRVSVRQEGSEKNALTLSEIFNGKTVRESNLFIAARDTTIKPSESATKTTPASENIKKEEKVKTGAPAVHNKAISKPATPKTDKTVKSTPVKPVEPASVSAAPASEKDVVIFRVQIITSGKPKADKKINLNGKSYDLFEYFFRGAYRYTIGEFKTLPAATQFQKVCRQSGYPDAFVAAFINNMRQTDPSLFK